MMRASSALAVAWGLSLAVVACVGDAAVTQRATDAIDPKTPPAVDDKTGARTGDTCEAMPSTVFTHATSDISRSARTMIDDLTRACRAIATDLDQPIAARDAAGAKAGRDGATAWCDLALEAVAGVKAHGTLRVTSRRGRACATDVAAKTACQEQCTGGTTCDLRAHPPTCSEGVLVVGCATECDVTATAPSIACEGVCGGACEGTCSATASAPTVACDGACTGLCTATASGGGIQADGSCRGACTGTCTPRAGAQATVCSGLCDGMCTAKCSRASGQSAVKCSGRCSSTPDYLACYGGALGGGCASDAQCEANCNASAVATATCSVPKIDVTVSGFSATAPIVATLSTNLPAVARIAQISGAVAQSAAAVRAPKSESACAKAAASMLSEAIENARVAERAALSLTSAVGID